jgi:hypothetical protein
MHFDLTQIRPEDFHQLCGHLLAKEFLGFRPVEGSGGDEGVDGWIPETGTYFQFHAPRTHLRKEKVSGYLEQAAKHNPMKWVLLTNRELNRIQWKWIDAFQQRYSFPIEVWGPARIWELVAKHPGFEDYVSSLQSTPQPQIRIGTQKGQTIANVAPGAGSRVTIMGARKPRVNIAVAGTVAEDPVKAGYLDYLIKRYNEFREWEIGKEKMNYVVIRVAYERELKFKVRLTPLALFQKACQYLQGRIEHTKLGRIRKAQGQKVHSTFEEFVAKAGV